MTDSSPSDSSPSDTKLELTLRLSTPEGELLESWDESEPLAVVLGRGDLPPALEERLAGRPVGHEVDVVLGPEEAFGAHDPERVLAIPRDQLEADAELSQGDWIAIEIDEEDGSPPDEIECRVLDMDDDAIYLDGNHPLAGRSVRFEVRVVDSP